MAGKSFEDLGLTEHDGVENHEAVVDAFFAADDEPAAEATEPTEPEAVPTLDDPAGDPEDEDEDSDSDSEEPESLSDELEEEEGDEDPDEDLDPVEKRLRGLQSLHDRQMAEVKAQLAQMQEWAQQVYQAQMLQHQQAQQAAMQAAQQPQQQVQHVTDAQIVNAVAQDAEQAFAWVATNRPDKMPTLIAATRANEQLGNAVADEMILEYQRYQLQQQQQQFEAAEQARKQAEQEREAPIQIQQTMASMIDGISQQYGEAFKAVEGDFIARCQETAPQFKEYMDSQGLEMSPDAIHYFLTKTFNDIREENLSAQAAKPKRARKVKPAEHVEVLTSGKAPEDVTADDLAIHEILEGAAALSIDTSPTR